MESLKPILKNTTPAESVTRAEIGRKEAQAQLEIMTALARVNDDSARRIVQAVGLILEADRLVPGILDRIAKERTDA